MNGLRLAHVGLPVAWFPPGRGAAQPFQQAGPRGAALSFDLLLQSGPVGDGRRPGCQRSKASAAMIWVNRWISRSSLSRSVMRPSFLPEVGSNCSRRRSDAHFDRRRCSQQTTNRDPSDPPVARSLPTPVCCPPGRVALSLYLLLIADDRRSAPVMSRLPSFTDQAPIVAEISGALAGFAGGEEP